MLSSRQAPPSRECAADCCSVLQLRTETGDELLYAKFASGASILCVCCSVLQCVVERCSVLQCVAAADENGRRVFVC